MSDSAVNDSARIQFSWPESVAWSVNGESGSGAIYSAMTDAEPATARTKARDEGRVESASVRG